MREAVHYDELLFSGGVFEAQVVIRRKNFRARLSNASTPVCVPI
jgi:hypothetical protein